MKKNNIEKMTPRECLAFQLDEESPADLVRKIVKISEPYWGPVKREWAKAPVEIMVGIGNDHTCYITMDWDDYAALMVKKQ